MLLKLENKYICIILCVILHAYDLRTYILFIFGMFDDNEDVEFFCEEVLTDIKSISSIRFIIENSQNIIVIFDSESSIKTLSEDVFKYLVNNNIKLYFIFERDTMVTAHLPQNIKDFIFNDSFDRPFGIKLDLHEQQIDLDSILDKIDQNGLESLTPEEKNFLDNFEKS